MASAHDQTDLYAAQARRGLAEDLPEQLSRLTRGWGDPLHPDTSRSRLLRSLAVSLVEAGLQLHHCAAKARGGGVCLTPATQQPGVIVTWTPHQALSHDAQRYRDYQAVLEVMNYALGDLLLGLGYDVREFGQAGANIVVGAPTATPTAIHAVAPGASR